MEGFIALYIFMLAAFTGYEVISKVPVILHTPLMSGSNFVHGIVLVGAMVALGHADTSAEKIIGFIAVLLGAGNADRGDRRAFEGGQQNAAERVTDRVAESGFEGFRGELRVGVGGGFFVFDETIRNLKRSKLNRHVFFGLPGFPLASVCLSQQKLMRPRGPTAVGKARGRGI